MPRLAAAHEHEVLMGPGRHTWRIIRCPGLPMGLPSAEHRCRRKPKTTWCEHKGSSHLYKGHRPVPLTNPLPKPESRVGQRKLATTRHYTHTVFLYRAEVCPAFMTLVLRAVQTRTLFYTRGFASVDWDESDAYLRPQRPDHIHRKAL